ALSVFCKARPPTQMSALSLHDALPIWDIRDYSAWDIDGDARMDMRETEEFLGKTHLFSLWDENGDGGADRNEVVQALRKIHDYRSEEHTSELQSRENLVCRLLLEKKNN